MCGICRQKQLTIRHGAAPPQGVGLGTIQHRNPFCRRYQGSALPRLDKARHGFAAGLFGQRTLRIGRHGLGTRRDAESKGRAKPEGTSSLKVMPPHLAPLSVLAIHGSREFPTRQTESAAIARSRWSATSLADRQAALYPVENGYRPDAL